MRWLVVIGCIGTASCADPSGGVGDVDAMVVDAAAIDGASVDASRDAPLPDAMTSDAGGVATDGAVDTFDAATDAGPPPMVEVPCAAVVATITTTPSSFSPTQVTVSRGQVVRFEPSTPHDATSGTPGEPLPWFMVYGGDPRCVRFDEPGTFPFFCTVHPTMAGRVIVSPRQFD